MTDPYNSASTYTPVAPAAHTQATTPPPARPVRDAIDRADVNAHWKKIFRDIESKGGADSAGAGGFNWRAWFLGPIYLLAKGLWRQAVVYFVIFFALAFVLLSMGFEHGPRFMGFVMASLASMRANVSYYRKVLHDDAPWF